MRVFSWICLQIIDTVNYSIMFSCLSEYSVNKLWLFHMCFLPDALFSPFLNFSVSQWVVLLISWFKLHIYKDLPTDSMEFTVSTKHNNMCWNHEFIVLWHTKNVKLLDNVKIKLVISTNLIKVIKDE